MSQDMYRTLLTSQATEIPIDEARRYARSMQERMQREDLEGVKFDDAARHAVYLLRALEECERKLDA